MVDYYHYKVVDGSETKLKYFHDDTRYDNGKGHHHSYYGWSTIRETMNIFEMKI